MRFRKEMEGVTPVLSDVPPAETMKRPDGPHSGNPHIREAVKNKEAQNGTWFSERSGTASRAESDLRVYSAAQIRKGKPFRCDEVSHSGPPTPPG
jgi:hypothetical protein